MSKFIDSFKVEVNWGAATKRRMEILIIILLLAQYIPAFAVIVLTDGGI